MYGRKVSGAVHKTGEGYGNQGGVPLRDDVKKGMRVMK